MEKRIKDYVNYQFRFDNREDVEEMKAEIIANLIDRYYDYVEQGMDEEEAYIEAIKQLGSFDNDVAAEYRFKPSFSDICLIIAAILSIFGLILIPLNILVGALLTIISIVLFSGASYYLYSNSQYIRKNYMDIEKHNVMLRKIFKYIKTCFIFWSLSLSIILAVVIVNIISPFALLNFVITDIDYDVVENYYRNLLITFLIVFLIIGISFILLYKNIMNKYYFLTGEKPPQSSLSDTLAFLNNNQPVTFKKIINSNTLLIIFGLIYSFFLLIAQLEVSYGDHFYSEMMTLFNIITSEGSAFGQALMTIIILVYFAINILSLFIKKINKKIAIIMQYILFGSLIGSLLYLSTVKIIYLGREYQRYQFDNTIYYLLLFGIILYSLILIIRIIYNKVKK